VDLENYLSIHPVPEEVEYYLCVPLPMNQAELTILDDYGIQDEIIAFNGFGG
jgi:Na+-transporting NADH:ubiquinone oxidoreductase subunit F